MESRRPALDVAQLIPQEVRSQMDIGLALQGMRRSDLLPLLGDKEGWAIDGQLRKALMFCVATRRLPVPTALLFLEDYELAESYLASLLGRETANTLLREIQRRRGAR